MGKTAAMFIVVSDATLGQVLASSALLGQAWPGAGQEVQLLLQILRVSVPSLAEALAVGLVTLAATQSAAGRNEVTLNYKRATLRALAQTKNGAAVIDPKDHLPNVVRLDILRMDVEGYPTLRLAG
jgi:hypothetical protein